MPSGDDRLTRALRTSIRENEELRAERQALLSSRREPIAIVGMGCRYPGGVTSPAELWDLVATSADAIAGFPADRGWDLDDLYDPDPDHPGTSYTREGGFLAEPAEFDSGVLRHQPARGAGDRPPAAAPAGSRLGGARGRRDRSDRAARQPPTGVFAGVMYQDYGPAPRRSGDTWTGMPASSPAGSPTPSASRARRSPSTPPARPRWWRCTWPPRRSVRANARWPWRAASPCSPPRSPSSSSPASAASPPTAAASPSPRQPTGSAGPRASACWCSSACPTPNETATRSSP